VFEWADGTGVLWTGEDSQRISLLYTNWASSQPNDFASTEECVEMLSSGAWDDVNCLSLELPFVCEIRAFLFSSQSIEFWDMDRASYSSSVRSFVSSVC